MSSPNGAEPMRAEIDVQPWSPRARAWAILGLTLFSWAALGLVIYGSLEFRDVLIGVGVTMTSLVLALAAIGGLAAISRWIRRPPVSDGVSLTAMIHGANSHR